MKKNSKRIAAILILALVVTMCAPLGAFGASSSKAPAAPKITSAKVSQNTVTLKWSKVKGADKYQVYRRVNKTVWEYWKTVKKTSANKKKYSDTSKYKLKVNGKKYKVYKKTGTKKVYKLIKTVKKCSYKFEGKYNKKYAFRVKAVKGDKESAFSKVKTVKTAKKPQTGPFEDPGKVYVDYLMKEGAETGKAVRMTAIELYKKLAMGDIEKGKSTMVSPISFLTAMGLLENGAKNNTLKEIEDAYGMNIEDFNNWYKNWYALTEVRGSGVLKLANSVWVRDDENLMVHEAFIDKIKEVYNAQIYEEPFNNATVNKVNQWVYDNTNGMIKRIVENFSSEIEMLLINATYFNGAWATEYEDNQILENQDFTRTDGTVDKVTMLKSIEYDADFFKNEYLTGSFKYYKNGYKIMFLLPNEGYTTKDIINNLGDDDLRDLERSSITANVDLKIPEFKFDYTVPDCIESLVNMGISEVFNGDLADLSGMAEMKTGENLYVSNILHKTSIDLNRKGTEAAAVTAIFVDKATEMPTTEKRELHLDRPFVFVIMDTQTSTPVFIGNFEGLE